MSPVETIAGRGACYMQHRNGKTMESERYRMKVDGPNDNKRTESKSGRSKSLKVDEVVKMLNSPS